jgi:hypothetical protein
MKKMPLSLATIFAFVVSSMLYVDAVDDGIPASQGKRLILQKTKESGTDWKVVKDQKTGEISSYDKNKAEMWFNPVTKKYVPAAREDGSPDPRENSATLSDGSNGVITTEKIFNSKTKRYEDIPIEIGPGLRQAPQMQYPNSLDNGLPVSTAKNWEPVRTTNEGPEWKTYKNSKTGDVISFNPRTSELWFNPVIRKWVPVSREKTAKESYIKAVSRELIMAQKPANARTWRCNRYGTDHNSPVECADPDSGGVWLK